MDSAMMSIKAMFPPGPTQPEIYPAISNLNKDNRDKAHSNNLKPKILKQNFSKEKLKQKTKKMEDYKS